MDRHDALKDVLEAALTDLAILSGEIQGPTDSSWQDVAGTACIALESLRKRIESIRSGETHYNGRFAWTGPTVFPSIADAVEHALQS